VRRPLRVLASVLVALGAGGGLAVAQDALRAASAPPEIVTDLEGPLFLLQGMAAGAPAVERCVTVYPRGGTADDLALYGAVSGGLAGRIQQEVVAGRAEDGIRATRDCGGFVPDRTLWNDTLDNFPTSSAPLVDPAPLQPGEPRVYRFRVRLIGAEPPPLDQLAEQDLEWRAELDPIVPTTPTSTTVVTETITIPGEKQVPTTPVPAPTLVPAPRPACATEPGERPIRVFVVDGRRVTLIVGPMRRLRPGEPLSVRLRDPAGVVFRASYELDGRPLPADGDRPWRAAVPVTALADGTSRLRVRVKTNGGEVRFGHVDLRPRPCAPVVRAAALAPRPSSITLDLDLGVTVRRVGVALPPGVAVARRGLSATASSRRPVPIGQRDGHVLLGAVRKGTALRVHVPVDAASRHALAVARCARMELVLRLEPVVGEPRYVKTPLMGRGGGC
jgi:hypothetical protein